MPNKKLYFVINYYTGSIEDKYKTS